MSNIQRSIKRQMLKKELNTNKISEEFHKRYGYTPNINKNEIKLAERMKRKLRKLVHLKSRKKKASKKYGNQIKD